MRFSLKWLAVVVVCAGVALLAAGGRGPYLFPQDNVDVYPVTITFSSPQDPAFSHQVLLKPDSLSAFDSRSTILMRVPDAVTIVEIHVQASVSSQAFVCDSMRFAEGRDGILQMMEQGGKRFYRVQLPPRRDGETEFYAANLLVQFCSLKYSGFGPDYSKRTYYFGMWYGPESVFLDRAKGIAAIPIEKLEQSMYVK